MQSMNQTRPYFLFCVRSTEYGVVPAWQSRLGGEKREEDDQEDGLLPGRLVVRYLEVLTKNATETVQAVLQVTR